jgi:hypothetical protein
MHPDELISALEAKPDQKTIAEACLWLTRNEDDELLDEVFEALLLSGESEDILDWSIDWLKSHPKIACHLLSVLIEHVSPSARIDLMSWGTHLVTASPQPNEDSAYLASRLIVDHNEESLVPWAQAWVDEYPDKEISAVVAGALVAAHPTEDNIERALVQLHQQQNWYGTVLLARLLETQRNPELIELASQKLSLATEPEVILLIEPLLKAEAASSATVIAWIDNNPDHPLSADILAECFRLKPGLFANSAKVWLSRNPSCPDPPLSEEEIRPFL